MYILFVSENSILIYFLSQKAKLVFLIGYHFYFKFPIFCGNFMSLMA